MTPFAESLRGKVLQRYNEEFRARSVLFNLVVEQLNSAHIKFCVLNSYDHLPDLVPSDVDCRVSERTLLTDFAAAVNSIDVTIVQHFQRESTAHIFIVTNRNRTPPEFIWFDVGSDFRERGHVFYKGTDVLDTAVRFKNFFIPREHLEFGQYLVKKVLRETLDERSTSRLTELYSKDVFGCRAEIARFWRNEDLRLIERAALEGNWESVRVNLPSIRSSLMQQCRRTYPSNLVEYWPGEIARRLRRWLRPTGMHLVYLGPDGIGKTTIADQVSTTVGPAFRQTERQHFAPGLLRSKSKVVATDPHGSSSRGKLGSTLKLGYWLVDFSVGHIVKTRPLLVRSTFISRDRYLHDVAIDPIRYRYGGSLRLLRLTEKLVPKPDLFIVLDAPAEVVQQRKSEVSFEESARQRNAYKDFFYRTPNAILVDANRPAEEVARDVSNHILDYMANRVRHRLKLDHVS